MADEEYKDSIAIIDDQNHVVTYRQLKAYTDEFAMNLRKRSIVIIVATNTIGSLVGYVSCLDNKCVPIMLRSSMQSDDILQYVHIYGVNYLWVPNSESGIININEWVKESKDAGESSGEIHIEVIYETLSYVLYKVSDTKTDIHDELALLLPTSGSTGGNRMVRISYKNLEENTKDIALYLNISGKDRAVTSLPMNYTYGLSVINTHLYKRAVLLLTSYGAYTKEFWDFFHANGGTSFAGVPYIYEMLKKMGFAKMNLPTLKTMTVAGGKIGLEEEKYYIDYAYHNNKQFIVMYGQTEATARISYRPAEMMKEKMKSIGKAIPNGQMWIEDENGKVITRAFAEGEIVYSGKNVAMGYAFCKEDLIKGYEWGNVLHTGDIGYRDDEGYFYVKGRRDRVVKLNGIRLNLQELEQILEKEFPENRFRCEMEKCMGERWFNRIRIYAERYLGDDVENEIVRYAADRIGINRMYFTVDERGME